MNEGLIARRYAKALLKYAQEKDKTLPVYEAARQVEASFIARPDLQEALLNPVLSAGEKEALMLSAAGVDAASSEEYLRFIREEEQEGRKFSPAEEMLGQISDFTAECYGGSGWFTAVFGRWADLVKLILGAGLWLFFL